MRPRLRRSSRLQGVGLVAAGVWLIVRALEPDAGHRASTEVLGALSVVVGLVIVRDRAGW